MCACLCRGVCEGGVVRPSGMGAVSSGGGCRQAEPYMM